jgi:hypothetical protein
MYDMYTIVQINKHEVPNGGVGFTHYFSSMGNVFCTDIYEQ